MGFNVVQVICFVVAAACVLAMVGLCLYKRLKRNEKVWYAEGFPLDTPIEPDDLPADVA